MEPTENEVDKRCGLGERILFECEHSGLKVGDVIDALIAITCSLAIAHCRDGKEPQLLSALVRKLIQTFMGMLDAKSDRPSVQ